MARYGSQMYIEKWGGDQLLLFAWEVISIQKTAMYFNSTYWFSIWGHSHRETGNCYLKLPFWQRRKDVG